MHFIIELDEQLQQLTPTTNCFAQVITNHPKYHPKLSWVSLVYYHNGDKGYIICVKHSEAFSISLERVNAFLASHKNIWVYDKKFHSYFIGKDNLRDIYLIQLSSEGAITRPTYETTSHRCMEYSHDRFDYLNEIIPISKHYEKWEKVREASTKWLGYHENIVDLTDVYKRVEESGIGITKEITSEYLISNPSYSIQDGKCYTSYNLYNPTGRPTNSFNGVNYLAIPKTKSIRDCFIPTNNYFVEFDFDAYHPRLVGKELGIDLPKEPLHEYFAKLYFNKPDISPEDYKRSKEITFRQMYGGVLEEYKEIEFFSKMSEKIDALYEEYSKNRYLILPTGVRVNKTKDINPTKLFNYWVQNLETLKNYYLVSKILNILEDKRTKLVLITYDSYLFDFSVSDGKSLLEEIKCVLQDEEMLVKHKWGNSYDL